MQSRRDDRVHLGDERCHLVGVLRPLDGRSNRVSIGTGTSVLEGEVLCNHAIDFRMAPVGVLRLVVDAKNAYDRDR